MSYLLYCIVRGDHRVPHSAGAVIMVRRAGLGAVLTEESRPEREQKVDKLLAYANVIHCYDSEQSVIPMRFGCVFEDLDRVGELLEHRQAAYRELLAELDGRTEMSVCVALDGTARRFQAPQAKASDSNAGCEQLPRDRAGAGIEYLAQRRRYYAMRESVENALDELGRQIVTAADSTFVRSNSEHIERDGRVGVEVHFLVERAGIIRFIDALGELKTEKGPKMSITGPWPAYNFCKLDGNNTALSLTT